MHDTRRWSLQAVIGATGIVYGDIGTSPLYAFETGMDATGAFDPQAVLGVLSLIFWSLMLSVTIKYVTVMMRADNQGEGGILALFALAQRHMASAGGWSKWLVELALAGNAFFFCDALITPAISVLSAVEGLELLDPEFEHAIIRGHSGSRRVRDRPAPRGARGDESGLWH
jgi:KUP system potassium uptake protein